MLSKAERMKMKELRIWIGIIAILIGGLWLLATAVNDSPSSFEPAQIDLPAVSKEDFVKGDPKAKVTLVEYSDFQCSACGLYFPDIKQLEKDFGNKLFVVYRIFPLIQTHQNSMIASQTAYAANLQGKFWEMHDLLFENQSNWSDSKFAKDIFIGYAKDLGMNLDKFKTDLDAKSTKKFVTDQQTKAVAIGLNSTPTFFVNGTRIQNPRGYEAFKKIIQDEINKK
jgi:protein-disulfide isomerase